MMSPATEPTLHPRPPGEAGDSSLTLPDGRRLGFAVFGAPSGVPLLYCHGTPGSRYEGRLGAAAARELGFRIIAVDRPGYGCSDPLPERTLLAWAEDLARLVETLGIDRFYLFGVSGGGPFAIAAAHRFGPRIAALGLVCPVGPLHGSATAPALPWGWRLLRRTVPAGERLLPALLSLLALPVRNHPAAVFRFLGRGLDPADQAILAEPGIRATLCASWREALRPGVRGVADDLASYARPWGFSLAGVPTPVLLWHGQRDRLVPVAMGRQLAAHLPHCRSIFPAAEGHFSLPLRHFPAILRDLYDAAAAHPMV